MKQLKSMLLLSLVMAMVSVSFAELVVSEGSLIAANTAEVFTAKSVTLDKPIYFDSVVFYNSGTNAVTDATLTKVDMGYTTNVVSTAVAADAGVEFPASGAAPISTNPMPLKTFTISAAKSAGTTNGTSSVLFYRVYGNTIESR